MTKGVVRRLSRTKSHRDAMLKNMVCSLLEQESIISTHAKLKEAQRRAERLITWSKHYQTATSPRSRQVLKAIIQSNLIHKGDYANIQDKLLNELSDRYKNRPGGYTRIIKLENRQSDKAPQSMLELVDTPILLESDGDNWLKPVRKGNMKFWLLVKSTLYDESMNQDYNMTTIGKLYSLMKPKLNSEILLDTVKEEMLQIRYHLLKMDFENNNTDNNINKFNLNIQEQKDKVDKLINIIKHFNPTVLEKKPKGWILMKERTNRTSI